MTIKICKKCGSTEIYKSGQCIPCKKAYSNNYRKSNQEKVKLMRAVSFQKNKEIISKRMSEYRQNNLEKIKQKLSEYRELNREKLKDEAVEYRNANKEKIASYKEANREKLNASSEVYRKANLGVFRILSHNRRARVASVGGRLSKDIAKKLYDLQKGRCPCCGLSLGDDYHLDHVIPIALGGSNTDANIQLLRKKCNLQKNKKHPVDFMQSKGFLL